MAYKGPRVDIADGVAVLTPAPFLVRAEADSGMLAERRRRSWKTSQLWDTRSS
jgi:hypothetical protein